MEQSGSTGLRRSLLDSAASRLNAEVFSHPVWVRFGRKDRYSCLRIADELLQAAGQLQENDPGTACQALLVCAVYLNHAGQPFQAFKPIQLALELSNSGSRSRERIWALWGGCAIAIQQGMLDQATAYFVDLQAALNEQDEWILADFIDVIRQSIFQPATGRRLQNAQDGQDVDPLSITLDWLYHWGFSSASPDQVGIPPSSRPPVQHSSQITLIHSFFSIQHWQGRWRSLMVAIRGELQLQWTRDSTTPAEKGVPIWRMVLRTVRALLPFRRAGTDPTEVRPTPAIPLTGYGASPPGEALSLPAAAEMPDEEPRATVPGPPGAVLPAAVHMLGPFRMSIGDLSIKLPPSRGLSVLKYLLLHRRQTVTREVLMDVFWPEAEPETARNNLNVAMHGLRKALRNSIFLPVILFQEGCYVIDSSLEVWLDVEVFENCLKAGRRLEARDQLPAAEAEYETAISLYQGDLLEQNLYEDWTVVERERLRVMYLEALDRLSHLYFNRMNYGACILLCQRILVLDNCSENAHRRLMRCYSRQGQPHLALKQYHLCAEAVRRELDTSPESATVELYEQLRHGQRI